MTTQKSLQMVLTTLLLVLAVLLMHWQEKAVLRGSILAKALEVSMAPAKTVAYTHCCLYHGLQAAKGARVYANGILPQDVVQTVNLKALQQNDSISHTGVFRF
ncbi:hypothetical protein [Pontibacter litorisediminis]|uniref:hypothetical protein n=1 Tax=Pontibacter litorisediminis TaxID=1846260 RepID=UPI0023EB6F32|nr:hypothetical protein [Pontibacter litorisediminis]